MKVFLICPVREATKEETKFVAEYVSLMEEEGHEVYWPARDTDQSDPCGLDICSSNREGMERADRVDVWWNPASQGSLFDLVMAFALRKPFHLVNWKMVPPTPHKSFSNLLIALNSSQRGTQ